MVDVFMWLKTGLNLELVTETSFTVHYLYFDFVMLRLMFLSAVVSVYVLAETSHEAVCFSNCVR